MKLTRSISIFILLMLLSGCISVRFVDGEVSPDWLEVNKLPGATEVSPTISLSMPGATEVSPTISLALPGATEISPTITPSPMIHSTPSHIIKIPQPAIKPDTWYFMAVTRQGRMITLYLDGRAVSFGEFDPLNLDAPISLLFGRQEGYQGMYLNGRIDEVEIYNGRALTQAQLFELYSTGSSGKCKGSSSLSCVPPPDGLTGWWPGDGNTEDIVAHRSGFYRDGAMTGPGLVDQAFALNGKDDFIEVPDDPALNFGTRDFTVDLWVNFTDLTGSQILVEKWIQEDAQEHNISQGWSLGWVDNKVWFVMDDGSGVDYGLNMEFMVPTVTHIAPPIVPSTKTATPTQTVGTPASASVCTDPIGCLKLEPNDPIHIAYLLDLVGETSSLGVDSRNGIEIAIDDSGGQILGHKIKLTGMDTGCNGDKAVAAAKNLVSDPTIVAVLGPSCSGEARAAGSILSAAGLVIISPSNTAVDLTNPNSSSNVPGYFRTNPTDADQANTAADFVYNTLGLRSVATIDDGGSSTSTLQQIFSKQFTRLGGTITVHTSISPVTTNMREILASIEVGRPDLIYMPIFLPAGMYVIEQARTIPGLENTRLMGSDGLYSSGLSSTIGSAVDGFLITLPAVQGPAYDDFLAKYEAKFGKAPINIFHAHAYDAFNILKDAIERVAVQEADGTIYIPRQALRNAIASTKDFPGITGNLTCNNNGDCANPMVGVYEYHTNEFPPQLIWPQP